MSGHGFQVRQTGRSVFLPYITYSLKNITYRGADRSLKRFLDKLERRLGRYAIHNLMVYVCVLYVAGLALELLNPGFYLNWLSLNPPMILRGQIWRLVTFLIQPPDTNVIFFILTLYLYYMLGKALEQTWGAFRFNVYYFSGVIFTIIGSFIAWGITGQVYLMDTYYINMSLFLAFALVYPDMQLLFMFLIPIRVKWLALLDLVFFAYTIIRGPLGTSICAILALFNFFIYFLVYIRPRFSYGRAGRRRRQATPKKIHVVQKEPRHRCAVCGRTSDSNPELEFRFCSKCNGNYEYCQDHIFNHKHVE